MKTININNVESIVIEGVDVLDYPDFCDAFIASAIWKDTGKELTEDELIELGDTYPEVVNEMAFESLI